MSLRLHVPTVRVLSLIAVLLAASVVLYTWAYSPWPPLADVRLPWWSLAVGFAATELVVINLHLLRHDQSVSLSEVIFVLSLVLARPDDLFVGRVVGTLAIWLFVRRQRPLKLLFNTSQLMCEALVVAVVFSALLPHLPPEATGAPAVSVQTWLAIAAALAAGPGLISSVSTTLAIALFEGRLDWAELRWSVTFCPTISALTAVPTVPFAVAVAVQPAASALLVGTGGGVLLAYRQYAALTERHIGLRRLYGYSSDVSSSSSVELALRTTLAQVRDLLLADHAEVLLNAHDGGASRHLVLEHGAQNPRAVTDDEACGRELLEGAARRLSAADGPAVRRWLEVRGLREAVVAPMHNGEQALGAIVAGHVVNDVRTFDGQDVELLETAANLGAAVLRTRRLLEQLQWDSDHDPLTGLLNRAAVARVLAAALGGESNRCGGCAVLGLDLDGFKEVNDGLGHAAGDDLLREVARRMLATLPPEAVPARLGGDEFLVVLPGLADSTEAMRIGRELRTAIEATQRSRDGLEVAVGVSVGVAVAPEHGSEVDVLLQRADAAMYAAKRSDHGPRLWSPERTSAASRTLLLSDLRRAVEADEIDVHLQPQADPRSRRVVGVEALARWTHPELGPVEPSVFIPVAERGGLIHELTACVLRRALHAAGEWRRAGHDLPVSVNVSTRDLYDPAFAQRVLMLLEEQELPPSALTLEITEGGVLVEGGAPDGVLDTLTAAGVQLSVDDFGTGYSSLSRLQRLTVHEVKVDQSFVRDMHAQPSDAAIVRAVVDLGRNLGMCVVAEGVEDERTWEALARLGCDRVQGYSISRALPLDQFLAFLNGLSADNIGGRAVPEQRPASDRPALRIVG